MLTVLLIEQLILTISEISEKLISGTKYRKINKRVGGLFGTFELESIPKGRFGYKIDMIHISCFVALFFLIVLGQKKNS